MFRSTSPRKRHSRRTARCSSRAARQDGKRLFLETLEPRIALSEAGTARLTISAEGSQVVIPAQVGVQSDGSAAAAYTTDTSGTLTLESAGAVEALPALLLASDAGRGLGRLAATGSESDFSDAGQFAPTLAPTTDKCDTRVSNPVKMAILGTDLKKDENPQSPQRNQELFVVCASRGGELRTRDLLHPKQLLRPAKTPVFVGSNTEETVTAYEAPDARKGVRREVDHFAGTGGCRASLLHRLGREIDGTDTHRVGKSPRSRIRRTFPSHLLRRRWLVEAWPFLKDHRPRTAPFWFARRYDKFWTVAADGLSLEHCHT